MSPVDLGRIELLVEQGFYANRAEFIRLAIHHELGKHTETMRETSVRQSFVLGGVGDMRGIFKAKYFIGWPTFLRSPGWS
ncbi:MAG: hypothetical protein ABI647_00735 [Gemmatimonadota bacterium]